VKTADSAAAPVSAEPLRLISHAENEMSIELKPSNTTQLQLTMQASMTQRYNFAVQHLLSAARFRTLCGRTEKENSGTAFGPFFEEIQSYATAAVLSSVAALEASINEVYIDAIDEIQALPGLSRDQVWDLWPHVEDKPILDKYQLTLTLCGREQMDVGTEPLQSVQTLIRIRNALVHFKPEWHNEQREHRKLGKQLQGKFALSPFPNSKAPVFPMRCMTQGLADWAICSVSSFASGFAERIDIKDRFAQFVDRIENAA